MSADVSLKGSVKKLKIAQRQMDLRDKALSLFVAVYNFQSYYIALTILALNNKITKSNYRNTIVGKRNICARAPL